MLLVGNILFDFGLRYCMKLGDGGLTLISA